MPVTIWGYGLSTAIGWAMLGAVLGAALLRAALVDRRKVGSPTPIWFLLLLFGMAIVGTLLLHSRTGTGFLVISAIVTLYMRWHRCRKTAGKTSDNPT
jgi:hypothetical protein